MPSLSALSADVLVNNVSISQQPDLDQLLPENGGSVGDRVLLGLVRSHENQEVLNVV